MSHTPGPWYVHRDEVVKDIGDKAFRVASCASWSEDIVANAALIAAAPELLIYAECEEARASSEDIAEAVLKKHGWNPVQCSATAFTDKLRLAALSKARGQA